MKNKENFAKEILDIACKGYPFSVTKSGEITFCDCFKCSAFDNAIKNYYF